LIEIRKVKVLHDRMMRAKLGARLIEIRKIKALHDRMMQAKLGASLIEITPYSCDKSQ